MSITALPATASQSNGVQGPMAVGLPTYTGGPLSRVQLAQLFHQVGFRGDDLAAMVAIAMRESGGRADAYNGNRATGDDSYGLLQINMLGDNGPWLRQRFGLASNEQLLDPLTNATVAFGLAYMVEGKPLFPWGPYRGDSPTFNTDLPAAQAAVAEADRLGLLGQPLQSGPGVDPAPAPAPAPAPSAAVDAVSVTSTPTLRIGARGAAVANLQRLLRDAGFSPGPIDGRFGPQTQAAVRQFQASRGITVDGWVGPQTWGRLLNAGSGPSPSDAASKPTLHLGARGAAVADLQRLLVSAGFRPGPIDGWFGPQTRQAVYRFQTSQGITVDGVVGPQTWGRLLGTGSTPAPTDGRLAQGATGPQVQELQQLLQTLGYYRGNIGGNFGPLTDAAVRSFQRDHGLAVDGWAGPQTMAALQQAVQGGGTPPAPPPGTPPAPSGSMQAALAYGQSLIGAPYRAVTDYRMGEPWPAGHVGWDFHADTNVSYAAGSRGYDCSGLVVVVYRQLGLDLAARGITDTISMRNALTPVSSDQLRPGDLLVDAVGDGRHVVIYLGDIDGDGNAEVLETTRSRNDGNASNDCVQISEASKFLGNSQYVGRRVPQEWYA